MTERHRDEGPLPEEAYLRLTVGGDMMRYPRSGWRQTQETLSLSLPSLSSNGSVFEIILKPLEVSDALSSKSSGTTVLHKGGASAH